MEEEIEIEIVTPEDAEELLTIYAPYVKETAISFEYEVPSKEEFQERIRKTLQSYPYLKAVSGNEILGYTYAGSFHTRTAYSWAAETTIYVKQDQRKKGIGRKLYQALENILREQNVKNMNACIGYPDEEDAYLTKNSPQFHMHMGYSLLGEFHQCGYKFGNWYNMVWMEKIIGDHQQKPMSIIPFPELSKSKIEKALQV